MNAILILSVLAIAMTVSPAVIAFSQETSEEETEMTEEEMEMTEEKHHEEEIHHEDMMSDIQSPRMQMENGIESADVVCEEGLELVIKTSTGSAACVKSSSVETLVSRGWGSYLI